MHANIESAIVIDYFWYVISNNLNISKNPYRYTSTHVNCITTGLTHTPTYMYRQSLHVQVALASAAFIDMCRKSVDKGPQNQLSAINNKMTKY